MLTIHHLNESRSQRVIWLAEELGLPYELVRHQRDPRTMLAPASLKALHPLGKAPMVAHRGRVLAETGAIVAALARGSALLPDEGTDAGDAVRYWLHYAEGSAMPPLVMRLVLGSIPASVPWPLRPVARAITRGVETAYLGPEMTRQLDWWEASLTGDGWFAAGRFTAADVMMSFPVEMAALRGGLTDRPATRGWLDRIHARPAYQRALVAGGPYSGAGTGERTA